MNDGMDIVEVIMVVEDCFGIPIPDATAGKLATWGDVHRYVVQAIGASDAEPGACLSKASFTLVRDKLCGVLQTNRRSIRPSTRLEDLLPMGRRRELWPQVAGALDLPRYCLGLPPGLRNLLFAVAGLACVVGLTNRNRFGGATLAAMLIAIVPLYLHLKIRYGITIPDEMATVGQLASSHMVHTWSEPTSRRSTWTANQVWQVIRHAVASSAGVPVRKVTPQTRVSYDPL